MYVCMYSLLISDGRPPPRWVSYFSRRHVVITEMFMSGIWPCMYVFVGIHFVMVATWLWKASQLFQFRVGFTSSLKFKKMSRSIYELCLFHLGWETRSYYELHRNDCGVQWRNLCGARSWSPTIQDGGRRGVAEEEVSTLQEIVFLTLRLPPPVVHFLTRTGADLAAALADSALAWTDLGLSFAYVCMYVSCSSVFQVDPS